MKQRNWSVYELNQLLKYGIKPDSLRAQDHRPVEYITGHVEFAGRDFLINQDVLIPRIESEDLIELMTELIKPIPAPRVADVGTGSGCLGISLGLKLYDSPQQPKELIFSDVSSPALAVAEKNIKRLLPKTYQDKSTLIRSDLLQHYPDKPIDVIVANLPYIPEQRLPDLTTSVKNYEPKLALNGRDSKGLALINELISQAEKMVYRPQLIVCEIDEFVKLSDFRPTQIYQIRLAKDQFDKVRFSVFTLATKSECYR